MHNLAVPAVRFSQIVCPGFWKSGSVTNTAFIAGYQLSVLGPFAAAGAATAAGLAAFF
jgi:hypothetical protein